MFNFRNMQNYKALGNLLNSLDRNSDNNLSVQLNVAKTIFVQNGYNITTYYKSAIKDYLNTELTPVDFKLNGQQAQQIINKYVLTSYYFIIIILIYVLIQMRCSPDKGPNTK